VRWGRRLEERWGRRTGAGHRVVVLAALGRIGAAVGIALMEHRNESLVVVGNH